MKLTELLKIEADLQLITDSQKNENKTGIDMLIEARRLILLAYGIIGNNNDNTTLLDFDYFCKTGEKRKLTFRSKQND